MARPLHLSRSAQAALAVLFGWRADNFDDGRCSQRPAVIRQGKTTDKAKITTTIPLT